MPDLNERLSLAILARILHHVGSGALMREDRDLIAKAQSLAVVEEPTKTEATPVPNAEMDRLLNLLELAVHRKGELWERCQGKGWPEQESGEFHQIREETVPKLRRQILALVHPAPAPETRTDYAWRSRANEVQWRNIRTVVRKLADLCFGSKDDPKYGSCWLAIVNSLTARDGLGIVELEPVPHPEPGAELREFLSWRARQAKSDWNGRTLENMIETYLKERAR